MNISEIKPFVRNVTLCEEEVSYKNKLYWDNQLIYVTNGSAEITIDNQKHQLKRGSVAIVKKGEIHSLKLFAASSFLCVHYDYTEEFSASKSYPLQIEDAEAFVDKKAEQGSFFDDVGYLNESVFLDNMHILEQELYKMYSEFCRRGRLFRLKLSNLLSAVIIDIVRMLDAKSSGKIVKPEKIVVSVINYIHAHYTEPITNKDIGREFSYNPNYINDLIKEATGYSLYRYVIMRRMSRAIYLLQQTDKSISEISMEIGFNEVCHFSKYFKQVIGVSPREYKSRMRNINPVN